MTNKIIDKLETSNRRRFYSVDLRLTRDNYEYIHSALDLYDMESPSEFVNYVLTLHFKDHFEENKLKKERLRRATRRTIK